MINLQQLRGEWALVTGASDGLGEAFARNLAKRGLSIVLVARNRDRLSLVGKELESSYRVKTKVLVADLSEPQQPSEIFRALDAEGIKIRILVNNAAKTAWGPFERQTPDEVASMIQINLTSVAHLCRLFFPHLSSHENGIVINVVSFSALLPVPYMNVYAATKAAIMSFSLGLHEEWFNSTIVVQTLIPRQVQTNNFRKAGFPERILDSISKSAGVWPPEKVVALSLKNISKDRPLVFVRWQDSVMRRLIPIPPIEVPLKEASGLFAPTAEERERAIHPPYTGPIECVFCYYKVDPPPPEQVGVVRGNSPGFLEKWFRIWKCPECLTIQSIDPVNYQEIYRDYPLHSRPRNFFVNIASAQLLKRLKKAGLRCENRVLDYGCGAGEFVAYLKERGWNEVDGYDPFVSEFQKFPVRRYDWIIMNDVLEHAPDPRKIIKSAAQLVKAGGHLVIGTPDSTPILLFRLEKYRNVLHQPFHRCLLTRISLEKLGGELGFEFVQCYESSSFNTLFPFVNARFLDEILRVAHFNLNDILGSNGARFVLKSPKLLFWGLFGYFFPPIKDTILVLKKV